MNHIAEILMKQRAYFDSGETRDVSIRKARLKQFYDIIKKHEDEIMAALKEDLNKSQFESYATEIGFVLSEISHAMKHVSKWAKPKRVSSPMVHFLSFSRIYQEPYGCVLIMSPWNYPFQLAMSPLVAAIAAGNCAVIKPSAYAPKTSEVIEKIIKEAFDESLATVFTGGREANKTLLDEKFDYIFFTGGEAVGKAVMESASKHLTPVTLELGGKSPCIVDESANVQLAAKRIVWGKFMNTGQTCIAPDYILVHKSVKKELITHLQSAIESSFGKNPETNPDYAKIINEKHFKRLLGLMEGTNILHGGKVNHATMQIAPTILDDVNWENAVMQEEIFGPLLPLIAYDTLDEAIQAITSRSKPLALYLFTTNKSNERKVLKMVSFGGGCINDTLIHLTNEELPFGGVGNSGIGQYHGRFGFDTFSHMKSVMNHSHFFDLPMRYPPYDDSNLKLVKKIMK